MRVLLFDIDGTLVRTGGAGKAAMEAALCEEFGVRLSSEEVPYSGRTDRAIGHDLLAGHHIEPTPANLNRLVTGYLERLPAYLRRVTGTVCPGVADLLGALRGRADVLLGLLTGNVHRTTGCGASSRAAGSATTTSTATTWPARPCGRRRSF